MQRNALVLAATIFLSSCCAVPTTPELPLPPEPTYPIVVEKELACLSQDVYTRLVERDVLCREDNKTLREIIKSTH